MLKAWSPGLLRIAARRLVTAILLTSMACMACGAQTTPPQAASTAKSRIVVPTGTKVTLALTTAVMAKTAKAGNSIYAETAFPVTVNNQMAIPAGTYVQGQIDTLTRPGFFSPRALFQIHFTKIIFANGYAVVLLQPRRAVSGQTPTQQVSGATTTGDDVLAAIAIPYVRVSAANDVLLDNGAQFDMVLQVPLRLDATQVAAAVDHSKPGPLPQFISATQCRPSPGTPPTVIPGTPGMPGTPDVVIPGMNGMPDTVIPGIPATPGTPDTVIGGTPDVVCPGPPVVTPNPKMQNYKQSFQIAAAAQVSGKQLPAGSYQVTWKGPGPSTQVNILQKGKVIFSVPARVVLLNGKSPSDAPGTRINSDGSISLRSLRFAGQTFALYFDQGAA